jgi:hypothetical protein
MTTRNGATSAHLRLTHESNIIRVDRDRGVVTTDSIALTAVIPYAPRPNWDAFPDLTRVVESIAPWCEVIIATPSDTVDDRLDRFEAARIVRFASAGIWNRARALNAGIAAAETDAVFTNDADCLWIRDVATEVLGAITADRHVVYRVISGLALDQHGAGMQGYRRSWNVEWDERYEGYGREDIDMVQQARQHREIVELSGGIVHLSHPRSERSPAIESALGRNRAIFDAKWR